MKFIASAVVEDAVRSQPLLNYALRYWKDHYAFSRTATQSYDNLMLKAITSLPVSTFEASYWQLQPPSQSLPALRGIIQARSGISGESLATLQLTVYLAMLLQGIGLITDAATKFATAFSLSKILLSAFHEFTVNCITHFFESIDDQPGVPLDDLQSARLEMLQYMQALHSQRSGPGSSQALSFHRQVASFYKSTSQVSIFQRTISLLHRALLSL